MARSNYTRPFRQTPFAPVALPFTLSALRELLGYGASPTAPYTHQQICDWAERYASALREEMESPEGCTALEVAEDVGAQWDLFLSNSYTPSELQALDVAGVVLPHEWFADWSRKLAAAAV